MDILFGILCFAIGIIAVVCFGVAIKILSAVLHLISTCIGWGVSGCSSTLCWLFIIIFIIVGFLL